MSAATRPLERPNPGGTFVGRDPEIARLTAARERSIAERSPQLVTVIGPAGIGKSRLVAEWMERTLAEARAAAAEVTLIGSVAPPEATPYGLIALLLRERFGIADDDGDLAAAGKVREVVRDLFTDRRGGEVASFIGRFLGFAPPESRPPGDDEQGLPDRIGRAMLRRFLELDAGRRPLVLALDELHRADDESIDFIGELLVELRDAALTIVAVARPELLARHARFGDTWVGARGESERIELGPLEPADAERMLAGLLAGAGELPRSLVDDAIGMTNGNPQFLEELVRVFHTEGIVARSPEGGLRIDLLRARRARLPVTVEEAIEARIAAVSPAERDLLEKAATFGNVFWAGALVALGRADHPDDEHLHLDEGERRAIILALEELAARDYLLAIPDSSLPGESEYVFKHNLERELVARMTPRDRARRLARLGAQWLETRIPPERTEEQLEFLATLHERGGNRQRAADTWLRAAAHARGRYAHDTAAGWYRRGVELLEPDDLLPRIEALHDLGDVLARRGRTHDALDRFEQMLRGAWLLDHAAKAGAAHGRIGRLWRTMGELDRAEHHLGLGLDLFSRAADDRGVASALDDLGKVSFLRGDWERAIERHASALELRRLLGDPRSIALAAHNLGQAARAAGRGADAATHFDEALRLRKLCGDRYGMAWSLLELGSVWRDRGDAERALRVFREGLAIARETGDRVVFVQLLVRLGEALAFAGRPEEASEAFTEAEEVAESLGDRLGLAEAMRLRGECRLALGDPGGALALCEEALSLVEETGSRHQRALAHRAVANVLGHSALEEDLIVADRHFRLAIDLLRDLGQDGDLVRALDGYADFLERVGEAGAAAEARRQAAEVRAGPAATGGEAAG
jgi:tetratricopeptide (TPR) repeat protein